MKAIVCPAYGNASVLRMAEVDAPQPKDGEVLIRVHAAEVTKADCELRSFRFSVNWFWLPLRLFMGVRKPRRTILGGYFSGVVTAVGPRVTRLNVGDAVYGSSGLTMGAYGEYLTVPESSAVVAKPIGLSFEEAACIPLGALNALHFIRKAELQPGEEILINGAGGSIGLFAVQIAKATGARVTAIDKDTKGPMLRRIGADDFIDYEKTDFRAQSKKYDVVFNMVAGASYSGCIERLKPGGRYLMGNPRLSDMLRSGFTPLFSKFKVYFAFAPETQQKLLDINVLIEKGKIGPVVDRALPLQQASEAHHLVESEERLGSIALSIRNVSP